MRGACHCGRVTISIPGRPDYLNVCNCTQCWQRGGLWGYFPQSLVRIDGERSHYRRTDIDVYLTTDFCSHCGITTSWTPDRSDMPDRMGINMRLFDAAELSGIEVRYGNGRDDGDDAPSHYRTPTVFGGAEAYRSDSAQERVRES